MFNLPSIKDEFLSQYKTMTSAGSSSATGTKNAFLRSDPLNFSTPEYNIWDYNIGNSKTTSPTSSRCTSTSSSSIAAFTFNRPAVPLSTASAFDSNNNAMDAMNSIFSNAGNNNKGNCASISSNNNNALDSFNNNNNLIYNNLSVNRPSSDYQYPLPTPCVVDNVYTAASRNQEEFVVVKSCSHVSYIVGKQGRKIREIRTLTQTYIETPVNGESPVFIVRGTLENIAKARELILKSEKEYDMELYQETQVVRDDGILRFNLFLPAQFIGLVVGRKGYQVKKVMDSCDVVIITPKNNTINLFKITGTQANIYLAIDKIKKHIESATDAVVQRIPLNDREVELKVFVSELHRGCLEGTRTTIGNL